MIGWKYLHIVRHNNGVLSTYALRIGPLVLWCDGHWWPRGSMSHSVGVNLSAWVSGLHTTLAGKVLIGPEYPERKRIEAGVNQWIGEQEARFEQARADLLRRIKWLQAHPPDASEWDWFATDWWGSWRSTVKLYQGADSRGVANAQALKVARVTSAGSNDVAGTAPVTRCACSMARRLHSLHVGPAGAGAERRSHDD